MVSGSSWLRSWCVVSLMALTVGLIGPWGAFPATAAEPSFDFSPKSGKPGTKVTVTVKGAPPNEEIVVTGDGKSLCTITTGSNGQGECSFKAPKGSGGFKLILTGENVSRSDIGKFKITGQDGAGGHDKGNGGDNKGNDNGGRNHGGGGRGGGNGSNDEGKGIGRRTVDCALGIGTVGGLGGVPGALLGCRTFVPDYKPATPDVEGTIDALGCIGSAVQIGAGLSAGTVGLGSLVGLSLSAVQVGLCIDDQIEKANQEFLKEHGGSTPLENLGPLPSAPIPLSGQNLNPLRQPSPTPPFAPSVPPIEEQDLPTFGDILERLHTPSSAPSASMVQEQQRNTRNNVCAQIPVGAAGCP